jgi:hypothetical protein
VTRPADIPQGPRRRGGVLLAALAGLAGLVTAPSGCGAAAGPTKVPTAGGAAATATVPRPPTTAQATALGTAINLRPSDLAGYAATPGKPAASDRQSAASYAMCAGAADPGRRVAEIRSDDFSVGGGLRAQQVNSSVTVMPSGELVAQDLRAIRSARGQACIASQLTRLFSTGAPTGVKFGTAKLGALAVPPGKTDGAFGYRVLIPGSAGGTAFRFYVDLLGFASGPAQVQLQALRVDQPFDAAAERRLYALLVSRARSAAAPGAEGSAPRRVY